MTTSKNDELDEIERVYGYRPEEAREKWAIFRESLIVADGNGPPRMFRPGCRGACIVISPHFL